MKETPSVAIIIINWNSFSVTSECLESLRSVDYPAFKVVVVDNGSHDSSGDQLKSEYPEIELLKNEKNLGFTGGNNTGITYAIRSSYEYIMLLNNDTEVDPFFLKHLLMVMVNDPTIGAVQPKIMFNHDRFVHWNTGGCFNSWMATTSTKGYGKLDKGEYSESRDIDWVTGCCFLTRADLIREIGPLDDLFFIYYEDLDWSLRLGNAGRRMRYEPLSLVYHKVGQSNKSRQEQGVSPFSIYMIVRNHLFIMRRYVGGIKTLVATMNQLFKIVGFLTFFLVRGKFSKFKAVLRGVRDGLFNSINPSLPRV